MSAQQKSGFRASAKRTAPPRIHASRVTAPSVIFGVALGLGALLFVPACGKSSGPLSGSRAGKQAAENYCDCLRKEPPPGVQEKTPAADAGAESDGKTAKAAGRRALGVVEKRIADCTQNNEARFENLMSRVPRTVEEAQEFSNTFHGRARECEDALRAKLEGANR